MCQCFGVRVPVEYNNWTVSVNCFVVFFFAFLTCIKKKKCWGLPQHCKDYSSLCSSWLFNNAARVNTVHYHNKHILNGMQERKTRKMTKYCWHLNNKKKKQSNNFLSPCSHSWIFNIALFIVPLHCSHVVYQIISGHCTLRMMASQSHIFQTSISGRGFWLGSVPGWFIWL